MNDPATELLGDVFPFLPGIGIEGRLLVVLMEAESATVELLDLVRRKVGASD